MYVLYVYVCMFVCVRVCIFVILCLITLFESKYIFACYKTLIIIHLSNTEVLKQSKQINLEICT